MKKNSFTILEVILAIFILTVAVGASFTLIQQSLISASLAKSKLTAAYLAQEGIEVIRNARDNNWLKIHYGISGVSWDDGLTDACLVPRLSPCDFYGDVNIDGTISQEDIDLINQFIAGFIEFDEEQQERADVNSDENIDILDINTIERYLDCLDTTFPVCSTTGQFQRVITVTPDPLDPDILEVSAQVNWQERGRSHQMEVLEYLYNWYAQ
jgi:type II secretory pathway pseudopilin PulG